MGGSNDDDFAVEDAPTKQACRTDANLIGKVTRCNVHAGANGRCIMCEFVKIMRGRP